MTIFSNPLDTAKPTPAKGFLRPAGNLYMVPGPGSSFDTVGDKLEIYEDGEWKLFWEATDEQKAQMKEHYTLDTRH